MAPGVLSPLALSSGTSMQDLAREGVWFTHAPCLTKLPAPVDPLVDFLSRRPDIAVKLLVCAAPFFVGMACEGMSHWDHAVCWLPHAHWPSVAAHLQSCVFATQSETFLAVMLDAAIPDRPLLDRVSVLPTDCRVSVVVVGLRTNRWRLEVTTATDPTAPAIVRKVLL